MNSPCWIWVGTRGEGGYGQIVLNGRRWKAHRLIYSNLVGDIPAGMFICHKCDNPPCVNPEHLFLGTCRDNAQDMSAKLRGRQQRITHCLRGHEYTPENTYFVGTNRKRRCRKCNALFAREIRRSKRMLVDRLPLPSPETKETA